MDIRWSFTLPLKVTMGKSKFLKLISQLAVTKITYVFGFSILLSFICDAQSKKGSTVIGPANWKLGLSLYTFSNLSFPEQLDYADSVGIKYVEGFTFAKAGAELKDSLIMNLSVSGIEKLKAKINKNGIKMESIYITGGKTVAHWKRDFEIAKLFDVKYVTAEPAKNMWDSVDSLAKVFGMKVALHNHWNGNSIFWHPDSVLAAIKGHATFGACPDLGHYPKSGLNPIEAVKKLEGKIIGIHLKDIAEYNNIEIKDVTVGAGIIDFPAIFNELKRQGFKGIINIERDTKELPNNLNSVKQTVNYYYKILKLPVPRFVNKEYPKAIHHLLIFNLKSNTSESDQQYFFERMNAIGSISGISNFGISKQINPNTKFKYVLSMDFDSKENYQAYIKHPKNQEFVQAFWLKMVEDFLVIDTEKGDLKIE